MGSDPVKMHVDIGVMRVSNCWLSDDDKHAIDRSFVDDMVAIAIRFREGRAITG